MADIETNENPEVNSNEEFYGKDAVTGSEADAIKDVVVEETNSGEILQMGTEGATDDLDGSADEEAPKEETPEEPQEGAEDTKASEEASLDTQRESNDKAIEALGKDLISKGVDFLGAIEEYQNNGELSQKTYEALEKAGYPKEVIQGFVETRKAIDNKYAQDVMNHVGGEKDFRELQTWMKGNLSKAELDAYNEAVNSDNLNAVKLILDGIQAKRVAKQGTRKATLLGGVSKSAPKGFSGRDEMIKAMSDPRYGIDRAYTISVERKMSLSNGLF
nr:MAG TPA: capsid assembly protein [Caudoviricetes sp.]